MLPLQLTEDRNFPVRNFITSWVELICPSYFVDGNENVLYSNETFTAIALDIIFFYSFFFLSI